jgi:hypothetical protein
VEQFKQSVSSPLLPSLSLNLGVDRPDLKQCVLDLITSSDGDIPLLMRTGDGNEADKAVFGKILVEFKKQMILIVSWFVIVHYIVRKISN